MVDIISPLEDPSESKNPLRKAATHFLQCSTYCLVSSSGVLRNLYNIMLFTSVYHACRFSYHHTLGLLHPKMTEIQREFLGELPISYQQLDHIIVMPILALGRVTQLDSNHVRQLRNLFDFKAVNSPTRAGHANHPSSYLRSMQFDSMHSLYLFRDFAISQSFAPESQDRFIEICSLLERTSDPPRGWPN